jgi:transcriptional regulator with GAF, ATPase, and Fis domain
MAFAELTGDQKNKTKFPVQLQTGQSPVFPIGKFQSQAAGLGFSNFDNETVIRKVPLIVAYRDSFELSFGCELARLYLNGTTAIAINSQAIKVTDTKNNQLSFPVDQHGRLRLNHFGNINDLHAIGFLDLLRQFETNPDSLNLEGKAVIVAVTASGVAGIKSTPLASVLPATLIHATVLENLIQQNYLREAGLFLQWIIIALIVAAAWLIFRCKHHLTIGVASFGVLLIYWMLAMAVFSFANTVLPLFYPTLAYIVTLIYAGITRSHGRRQQEDAIKKLLNDQIKTKESELEGAKKTLAEIQSQLEQEETLSEQTRQLAEERQSAIFKLETELRDLQTYIVPKPKKPEAQFPEIIHSKNSKMVDVLELVATVSSDDIPILILGETGTGKEMVARAIHNSSKRKNAPFVAINCGALSETLLESELFGHEKGSFTGAQSRRRGRFELAHGGTVFLDEITETTPAFQTRLLRVLQEGSFERLGSEQTIKVDVRVIAATNKDLQVERETNRFRSDLFYRLNGFPITLPPLRERPDDIPLLALHFLKKHQYQSISAFSDRAMEILQQSQWHGNVRELENVVRRAAILAQREKRNIIREHDLPEELLKSKSIHSAQTEFKPLEDQILDQLRSFGFSRSAISQTAKALGNRDRGTITEYFRGICFENLVNSNFDIEAAARSIANSKDIAIIERIKIKINEYLFNLHHSLPDFNLSELSPEILPSLFKGLPKKYHTYLQQVIQNLDKIET